VNILVTSASRKVSLVRAFQAALAELGGGQVVAIDISPLAPALYVADHGVICPRSDSPDFVPVVLKLCREREIGLVVPTRDEELPVFAAQVAVFAEAGATVAVCAPDVVEVCQDKVAFGRFCLDHGLPVPEAFADAASARLPAFVKPRRGKGGSGATAVHTPFELEVAISRVDEAVIQELVEAPEYTIDVFADLTGQLISVVPRQRIQVVAGESYVSRTEHRADLRDLAQALATALPLVGHVTVQCFVTERGPLLIEVNPRFGGGAALGWAAGAPTPRYLVQAARGEPLTPHLDEFTEGLVMLRHTDDLFLYPAQLLGGSG
jgi:carbamoyl-phosphate synthase large subunit